MTDTKITEKWLNWTVECRSAKWYNSVLLTQWFPLAGDKEYSGEALWTSNKI